MQTAKASVETVIVNSYGDTAQQIRIPNARTAYQAYLNARCDAHVQVWLFRGGR